MIENIYHKQNILLYNEITELKHKFNKYKLQILPTLFINIIIVYCA